MSERKIKIAIVGVGRWGKNLLREFNSEAEIAYVLHQDNPKTDTMLAESYPNIQIASSYNEILGDKSVKAVVIATPTETHYDFAIKALQNGKHVFLEKPGTEGISDMIDLQKEAEKKRLKLAVGYEFAHHGAVKELRRRLDFKKLTAIHFSWIKWGTFRDHAIPHLLCHEISICNVLGLKDFQLITCFEERVVSESDIVYCNATSGAIDLSFHIDRAVPLTKSKTVKFIGENEVLIWQDDLLFRIEGEKFVSLSIDVASPVREEVRDFLDAIRNDRPPLVDAGFAVEVWDTLNKFEDGAM